MMNEEGPPPMKDLKPVQRNPTAADKFWNDHQAGYDHQMKPAGQCHRVERHNDAFPKLKDELDKKRSVARTNAVRKRRNSYSANRTEFYLPENKHRETEKRDKYYEKKHRKTAKRTRTDKRSRVTKNKRNNSWNREKMMKIKYEMASSTKGSHPCCAKDSNNKKDSKKIFSRCISDSRNSVHENGSTKIHQIGTSNSIIGKASSKTVNINGSARSVNVYSSRSNVVSRWDGTSGGYPDTSLYSATSYDSALTTDDEPMVDVSKSDVASKRSKKN